MKLYKDKTMPVVVGYKCDGCGSEHVKIKYTHYAVPADCNGDCDEFHVCSPECYVKVMQEMAESGEYEEIEGKDIEFVQAIFGKHKQMYAAPMADLVHTLKNLNMSIDMENGSLSIKQNGQPLITFNRDVEVTAELLSSIKCDMCREHVKEKGVEEFDCGPCVYKQ